MSGSGPILIRRLQNVVYVNSRETKGAIICNGERKPREEGFRCGFRRRAREDCAFRGVGIVNNPEYADMSPEEIVLTLTALYPMTDDRRKAMDRLGRAGVRG